MTSDGELAGEIAHIEGALPTSARFNPGMTNEERRAYDNLLLMCGTHHTIIDSDKDKPKDKHKWPVPKLVELKRAHEAIYTAAIDKLRLQVGDITDGVSFKPAANGKALQDAPNLSEDQLDGSCTVINQFAERLSKIPLDARSLLAIVIARGKEGGGLGGDSGEVNIPVAVLESVADCSPTKLRQHADVLEHFGLLYLEHDPFEGPPVYVAHNSTPEFGWPLFLEIRAVAGDDHSIVRRILCELDFTAFDK